MVGPWLTELYPAQPQLLPNRWNSFCSTSVSPSMMVLDVPSVTLPKVSLGPPMAPAPRHIIPRQLPELLVVPWIELGPYPGWVGTGSGNETPSACCPPTCPLQWSWNGSARGLHEPSLHCGPCEPM